MLDQAQGLYKGNSAGKEGKERRRWNGPEKREFRSLGSSRGVELALCGRRRRPALETGWEHCMQRPVRCILAVGRETKGEFRCRRAEQISCGAAKGAGASVVFSLEARSDRSGKTRLDLLSASRTRLAAFIGNSCAHWLSLAGSRRIFAKRRLAPCGVREPVNRRKWLASFLLLSASGFMNASCVRPKVEAGGHKVIVLGIDGLDPQLLHRYMQDGRMPNFSGWNTKAASASCKPASRRRARSRGRT